MENNIYLIKAMDAYPYNLEEAVESLNYALSVDPKSPMALSLMGRLYMDFYNDYTQAVEYFEAALAEDVQAVHMYAYYLNALILKEDYAKALRFIKFALSVHAADKALIYMFKAAIHEGQKEYKKAISTLEKARVHSMNNDFICYLDRFESRLKGKETRAKARKKAKKEKEKQKAGKAKKLNK